MRELGYVEGKNVVFERRWGGGPAKRLNSGARKLADSKVNVIVTAGTPAAFAAERATSTIPIVMALSSGSAVIPAFVKTLAKPGGNVTGRVTFAKEQTVKELELVKEIVPSASRVAIVGAETFPNFAHQMEAVRKATASLHITTLKVDIRKPDELNDAFARMVAAHVDVFVMAASGFMSSLRPQVIKLAAKYSLPSVSMNIRYPEKGGLAALGEGFPQLFTQAANFVDKVLKGAMPATLPAERQSNFELVLNLKTAKALGVTIPNFVLFSATKVIK